MFSFHMLIIGIYIFIKSRSSSKEAAILGHHVSKVVQNAHAFTLPSQLV